MGSASEILSRNRDRGGGGPAASTTSWGAKREHHLPAERGPGSSAGPCLLSTVVLVPTASPHLSEVLEGEPCVEV